jgi:two-component system, NtrC family, nitrogen regulation sensor histidine kinase GlnL
LPLFERARHGGEGVVQRELAWPSAGGVDRILDCAVTQITLGQENLLLLEIEDITQHRRLTRENALLAQLGGSRLMVRQLAHEIKNPLGGLRGAAQLLERELLGSGALREYTRVIISEADRLTQSARFHARVPAARPRSSSINVHELLERVYHLLRSEAPRACIVDRDYDPSLPPLTVDPNHIIQAMLNLGRNAMQALSGGQVHAPRLICARARQQRQHRRAAPPAGGVDSGSRTTARRAAGDSRHDFLSAGHRAASGTGFGLASRRTSSAATAASSNSTARPGRPFSSFVCPWRADERTSRCKSGWSTTTPRSAGCSRKR